MKRCLQLAAMGAGRVAPNPMVGAVLVFADRIIGEGYHQVFGAAHAEVNCINSVMEADRHLVPRSTMYVSLEPCSHYGKTPPCADLIIENRIPDVVIGCQDSFAVVNGKGIERLRAAGITVTVGVLEKECIDLNKPFFTFHQRHRPYIILKWAQSSDGMIGATGTGRVFISNGYTNRLVHKWRSEAAAILIGTNTALLDDPSLTTRLWPGKHPLRLVIDKRLQLPVHLKLFDGSTKTIVFNCIKQSGSRNLVYHLLDKEENILAQVLAALYTMQVQSVLVEGGSRLLQAFIDEGLWDEARVIINQQLTIGNGISAPVLKDHLQVNELIVKTDSISFFKNERNIKI